MQSREDLVLMIRESSKLTAYTVEWFSYKFKPTDDEVCRALANAEQTVKLIKQLQEVRENDRKDCTVAKA
jgi:hypothetical protein